VSSDTDPLITLTTDIGWAYAAQMKGVILSRNPRARIIDLTHDVPPHQILEGAFLLLHMARPFPPGCIHVAVVDPGVGGSRERICLVGPQGTRLVGPDNGVLSPLAEILGAREAYRLDPGRVIPGETPSATFEGRDIFAPAAARLSRGESPESLGPPVAWQRLKLPEPVATSEGFEVTILHVDRFGNCITNVPMTAVRDRWGASEISVVLGAGRHRERVPIARTYSDLPLGTLAVLGSSFGLAELSVNQGRADERLHLRPGEKIFLQGA
jgi:S-adenosylmethionine hydrolase